MAGDSGKKEEMSKVKIISTSHVKPGKMIGRKECQLVTFDLPYLAFYYNQKLLFYKCGEFEAKVEKLKDGLRVVLEEFYQIAGKLGKDEDGVFRVEYDDDMDGVEVVEATAMEIGIEELATEDGTASFKDLIPYTGVLNLEGLHRPLLSVQVTKLKDGVAMGCAFNHAILDGTSTWHFMSSWAQICSGSNSVSVSPFLERTKVRNTRVKLDLSLPPNPVNGDANQGPQLREKLFRFSEAAIDKIKSKVNSTPPSDSFFTLFADCRKRVDPPMPESYFGNLIHAIFTVTAAGLLLASPPQFGASLVQKAIEAHNAKAIEERNKEWEAAPKIFEYKDAGVNCVAVGSSPRFKVYDVDFGWGKPEGVRSGSNNRFDGMVYLYQGKSGGRSIDVEIALEAGALEKLQKDKAFVLEV
ncbi:hypothetical protein E1A91_A08G112000v1 [Gossypium mustelinum]|uniref:BAHD acyltransferase DCR n=1 Tax=Gossypium mustelinum TaxID=34275 RepID=A0A5D2Y750_GOSMU|nr:hypothetical protein E1A91_A08G112000v1 [Gossypium mustelinum]